MPSFLVFDETPPVLHLFHTAALFARRLGIRLTTTSSIGSALHLVSTTSYDAVIADGGSDLRKGSLLLRDAALHSDAYRILMTAYPGIEDFDERVKEACAQQVLHKPFSSAELMVVLTNLQPVQALPRPRRSVNWWPWPSVQDSRPTAKTPRRAAPLRRRS